MLLIADSTKTIRLLALDFYVMRSELGFAHINYIFLEISSS